MTKYVPTGRPPGRPSNAVRAHQEMLAALPDVRTVLANRTCDPASVPMNTVCPDCFPEGWQDRRSLNCQHGIWVKRL